MGEEKKKGTETPNVNPTAEKAGAAPEPKKSLEAQIADLLLEDQRAQKYPPTVLYTPAGALSMAARIVALLPKQD